MKEVIMKVPSFSADYPKAPIYVTDLVRCKECVRNGEYTDCPLNGYAKTDDSFCSYGEREGE